MIDNAFSRISGLLKLRRSWALIERISHDQRHISGSGPNKTAFYVSKFRLPLLKGAIRHAYIVIPLLAIFYCMLFQRLRPYDLDNPWFLSFSYNMCHGDVNTDEFEQVRFPNGMDGTHLFGRLAASAQCLALNKSRWLPRDAALVTIFFLIASLSLWWGALRRLGFSSAFVGCFILLLGIWEPTVNMSGQFRYEFFSFFLMSLAFWLATIPLAVLALTVAFLAAETQPAALVAIIPTILVLNVHISSRIGLILRIFVAALVVGAAYVWLHPYAIQSMLTAQGGVTWKPFSGGLISLYFIRHPRHILELVVLIVGGLLFWFHRADIIHREIGYIAAFVTLYFLIMPHPNPYYMPLALPFPLLAALLGFQRSKHFAWMLVVVAGLMLGSYAYRIKSNSHQGYDTEDIASVGNLIRHAEEDLHLRDSDVHIVGDWSLWYAHPHYYLSSYAKTAAVEHGDLYLCDEQDVWKWGNTSIPEQVSCASLKSRVSLELVAHLKMRGRQLSLYKRTG